MKNYGLEATNPFLPVSAETIFSVSLCNGGSLCNSVCLGILSFEEEILYVWQVLVYLAPTLFWHF